MQSLFEFLEKLAPQGGTNLNRSMRQFLVRPRRSGLAILISDLLSMEGFESGLRTLLGRGNEAVLIHLLSPDEIEPPFAGDLQLVDVESGRGQDVSLDGELRRRYRNRIQSWIRSTQAECRKLDTRYIGLTTNIPWEQALLLEMRRSGVLK